ncbi:MAG: hypothetical protein ACK5KS_07860 [Planctomyces sp.]|jgi:hypothetical protein
MVMSLPPDFSEFLKLLNCHHVDYLLVGGFAVGFHGYPRATSDMDIWVSQSPENAGRVVAAIRIEVMNEVDGVTFEECRPAAILAFFDGIQVPIISLGDLKRNKLASGRPKDIDDLQQLP